MGSAETMGLEFSNYFEPVNEGGIVVGQFNVSLTPLGVIMPLFSQHGGGWRVGAEPLLPMPDILPTATLHPPSPAAAAATQGQGGVKGGGGFLLLTLINRNATQGFVQPVSLLGLSATTTTTTNTIPHAPGATPPQSATVQVFAATGPTPDSTFVASQTTAPVSAAGELSISCPAYSVVQVRVDL